MHGQKWDDNACEFKGQDDVEVQKCLQLIYQVHFYMAFLPNTILG